ncbi:hypothetical protein vseg_011472 [Gypsophila vaccaria]
MEAENVLNLLDSYWYDLNFFNRQKPIIPEIPFSSNTSLIQTIPTLPSIHTTLESTPNSNLKQTEFSASPNSVLHSSPKLQTIFSGKQTEDYSTSSSSSSSKGNLVISHTRKKKRLSKSLSDLEFEELKGFMDLGFVFSEDDKDSILGSIIPGLQRLNTKNSNITINSNVTINSNSKVTINSNGVVRPYLSEAWEVLEKKRRENINGVIKWKVPPVSNNQIDMKGYLKSWAHVVASTIK